MTMQTLTVSVALPGQSLLKSVGSGKLKRKGFSSHSSITRCAINWLELYIFLLVVCFAVRYVSIRQNILFLPRNKLGISLGVGSFVSALYNKPAIMLNTHTHTHTHTHTRTHTRTRTDARTHARTHTHTHARARAR